jgi:phosphate transport system substrate-binding protein
MDSDADMGGTCRFMLHSEQSGQSIKAQPVAWDALVAIVHKNNPVDDISMENLRAVYQGEISNWKQLGGPDRPLKLFVRKGKISGVGRTLRKLVLNDFDAEIPSKHEFKSSGPLEKALLQDEYAIGVTGISSARRRDVKILSLNGKNPSYENIKKGDYVLYRPLYIVINYLKPQSDAVEQFLEYALSDEGKEIIRQNGTVPYRDGYKLIQKMFRQNRESFKNRKS